ncbi:hypothetical protein E3N88_09485 [Mikania micrantha]|uniref:Uncharacterized protein n=1 Tax=Mikania micrantha TaxID=192012 RepID=A0A5N6PJ56_9ASTR|nr:hypothetical protein E3N88_09485 [Mikania micrantha]
MVLSHLVVFGNCKGWAVLGCGYGVIHQYKSVMALGLIWASLFLGLTGEFWADWSCLVLRGTARFCNFFGLPALPFWASMFRWPMWVFFRLYRGWIHLGWIGELFAGLISIWMGDFVGGPVFYKWRSSLMGKDNNRDIRSSLQVRGRADHLCLKVDRLRWRWGNKGCIPTGWLQPMVGDKGLLELGWVLIGATVFEGWELGLSQIM